MWWACTNTHTYTPLVITGWRLYLSKSIILLSLTLRSEISRDIKSELVCVFIRDTLHSSFERAGRSTQINPYKYTLPECTMIISTSFSFQKSKCHRLPTFQGNLLTSKNFGVRVKISPHHAQSCQSSYFPPKCHNALCHLLAQFFLIFL